MPPMLWPISTGFVSASCPHSHNTSSARDFHRIGLARLVALAVAAQVDGYDAMAARREMLELRIEVAVVTAPAVDQDNRRRPASLCW